MLHVAPDDGPDSIIESMIGMVSAAVVLSCISGTVLDDLSCDIFLEESSQVISWTPLPDFQYKVKWSETLSNSDFQDLFPFQAYLGPKASYVHAAAGDGRRFYRVVRLAH